MKYFILTFGCQQNYADSEKISAILNSLGYEEVSEKDADIVFIVACSVRQKAVDRIWGKVKNKSKKYIICGCVLDSDKKILEKKADLIFDSKNISDLPEYLKKLKLPSKKINGLNRNPKDKIGYVSIGIGCNNFCSYCAVPYTRGREIYFDPEQIVSEASDLILKNCKEIMLLAQNVNSYKSIDQQGREYKFVDLLKLVNSLEGDFAISFLSPHPKDTSDDLIEAISSLDKVKKELHLPLQSGDDEILRKMNRHYTADHYLSLVKKLRQKIPNILLSTDIIVGFCGETEEQFANTYNICKVAKFYKAYVSQYSPRKGTLAQKNYPDDIAFEVKKKRWDTINTLINKSNKKPSV